MDDDSVLADQRLLDSLTWDDGIVTGASVLICSEELEESSKISHTTPAPKEDDTVVDMVPVIYCIEGESEKQVPHVLISDSKVELKISREMLDQWNADAAAVVDDL